MPDALIKIDNLKDYSNSGYYVPIFHTTLQHLRCLHAFHLFRLKRFSYVQFAASESSINRMQLTVLCSFKPLTTLT